MSNFKLEVQVIDFLKSVAQKEIKIQNSRNNLLEFPDFNPFLAFQRIDKEGKSFINVENLYEYLNGNKLFCSENEVQALFLEKGETQQEITYQNFLEVLSVPQGQSYIRSGNYLNFSQDLQLQKDLDSYLVQFLDKVISSYNILVQHRVKILKNDLLSIEELYQTFDKYNKGYLEYSDFESYCDERYRKFSEEEYISILQHLGLNQDKISFKYFQILIIGKFSDHVQYQQQELQQQYQNVNQDSSIHQFPPVRQIRYNQNQNLESGQRSPSQYSSYSGKKQNNNELQQLFRKVDQAIEKNELEKMNQSQQNKSYKQQLNETFNRKQYYRKSRDGSYEKFVQKKDKSLDKRSPKRSKKEPKVLEDFKSTKELFPKRNDELQEEFYMDYKYSPGKTSFYKRDYNFHLDVVKPQRYLLGPQERQDSVSFCQGSDGERSQQQQSFQASPSKINLQSFCKTTINQTKSNFLNATSPIRTQTIFKTDRDQSQLQQFSQKNLQNTSQNITIQQQSQQQQSHVRNLYNQNYRSPNYLTSMQTLQSPSQVNLDVKFSPIKKVQFTPFKTQMGSPLSKSYYGYDTPMTIEPQSVQKKKIGDDLRVIVNNFLEGLDGLQIIEEEIEKLRCTLARNYQFKFEDLFDFYKQPQFDQISGKQFCEIFNDFKLIIKEEQSTPVLKRFDINNDHALNLSEFEKLFKPTSHMYNGLLDSRRASEQNSMIQQQQQESICIEKAKVVSDIVKSKQVRELIKSLLSLLMDREIAWENYRIKVNSCKNFDAYRLFEAMDGQDKGQIDFYAYEQFLKNNGFRAPNRVYLQLFNLFDVNQDGVITYSELLTQLNPKKQGVKSQNQSISIKGN